MKPEWLRVIALMRDEEYRGRELLRLIHTGKLYGAPVQFFRGPSSRMMRAIVVGSRVEKGRSLITLRTDRGAYRTVELSRLMYIDGQCTRLAVEDSLRLTTLMRDDALDRYKRAKPGTPARYRAAEDIKRGDREVARLTEEDAPLREAAYTLPSGERRTFYTPLQKRGRADKVDNDLGRPRYQRGDRVLFTDDNQCEVRGVIRDRDDYPDRLILAIALDEGGYYRAILLKRGREANE